MHYQIQKFPCLKLNQINFICCLAVIGLITVTTGISQSDDFNDGNDDGWTQYDPIAEAASGVGAWSFPDGGYRIQSSPSPAPTVVGPGRAGSIRLDVSYTDFYMAVDIVNWDPNQAQAIGMMSRIKELGLGTTDGYAMTYQVEDGDIDITPFTDEVPGDGLPLDGSDVVNMIEGQSYRYVFQGKGVNLSAQVFLLPNVITPIVSVTTQDATYSGGFCGLLIFDNSSTASGSADVTFDNYFASDVKPPILSIELSAFGDLSVFWSTNATDFILQARTSLDVGSWVDIAPPYSSFGGAYIFSEDKGAQPSRFYRLMRP